MPRKAKKQARPVVQQSAVKVTITALLPVTEGYEVNDINEYISGINQGNNDVTDLFNNMYYKDAKAKASLTVISSEIPETIQPEQGE